MMMSLLAAVVDCDRVDCDCVDFVVSFSSAQLRFDGVEDEEAAADDVGGPVDVGGLIRGVPEGAWCPDCTARCLGFDPECDSRGLPASHRFDFSCRKSYLDRSERSKLTSARTASKPVRMAGFLA